MIPTILCTGVALYRNSPLRPEIMFRVDIVVDTGWTFCGFGKTEAEAIQDAINRLLTHERIAQIRQ